MSTKSKSPIKEPSFSSSSNKRDDPAHNWPTMSSPSTKSESPKALSRQHSREPSVSKRGDPAANGLLRRQTAVTESVDPLPRRLPPAEIPPPNAPDPPPNIFNMHNYLNLQENWRNGDVKRRAQVSSSNLPRRLSPSRRSAHSVSIFEPFRNHMHMESGNTILELDDGTSIDMGNVDIETAFRMLRRVEYTELGAVTYSIADFPNIEMGILPDGSIVSLHNPQQPQPPQPESNRQVGLFATLKRLGKGKNKIAPAYMGGRTRARKMGRKGRKGTNKCRRYIVAKTRRQRRGNNVCALRRT